MGTAPLSAVQTALKSGAASAQTALATSINDVKSLAHPQKAILSNTVRKCKNVATESGCRFGRSCIFWHPGDIDDSRALRMKDYLAAKKLRRQQKF